MHLTVVCGNTCFRLCGALFHVHNSNAFDGDGDGFVNASQKSSYAMTIEKWNKHTQSYRESVGL